MIHTEDELSPLEREALAHWRADVPAPGFAERVLDRAAATPMLSLSPPAPTAGHRGFAAAAVLALLLGGLWSVRGFVHRGVEPAGPGGSERAHPAGYPSGGLDGGPRPEVQEAHIHHDDGPQAHAS